MDFAIVRPTPRATVERVQGLRRGCRVLAIASLVAGASATAAAAPRSHHGDALVRVTAAPTEVEALGLDVWTHGAAGPSVLARVTLQQRALLDISGLDYVVVDPDLGPRVEAERARLLTTPPSKGGLDPGFYADYHSFVAVLARLAAIVANRPDRVSHVELGLSLEGRLIRGVRITNPGAGDRPVVVVQGCQHAREWISVMSTVFAAEQFATAAAGTELDTLLDEVELVVVPIANPDGYVYTWDVDRFWRKNRRDGQGVDTNRNWSVAWGGEGASADPAAENYRGAAPFSEPEPVAMRDFVEAGPRVIALLDVHSFGQLVLFPWGYDVVDSDDHELFAGLAADIADVMTSQHGVPYQPLQSAELYPAAGNSADWAYGTRGIYAVSLELRPGPDAEEGFVLAPSAIEPTGEEVVAAITELMETAVELGPGEPGGGDTGTTGDDTTGGVDETTSESSSGLGESTGEAMPATSEASEDGHVPLGTTGTTSNDSDGDAMEQELEAGEGCGCRHGHGTSGAWWAIGALGLGLRRRQRTSIHTSR
jgi:MYXO-CTERM domain-containing protein